MTAITQPARRARASIEIFHRLLPLLDWLPKYRRDWLTGDIMAGTITAIVLVPQAMAYAMLAGLPPHAGLYASILPLLVYGLFGGSRTRPSARPGFRCTCAMQK